MKHRYIRVFIVFRGAFGVANLSRCNIYSNHFNWKAIYGSEVLHIADFPILCYMVGFVKASNILEPVLVGTMGNHIKDVTMMPLAHEFDRLAVAVAVLAGVECTNMRAWGDGIKVQTRWRTAEAAAGTAVAAGPSGKSLLFL